MRGAGGAPGNILLFGAENAVTYNSTWRPTMSTQQPISRSIYNFQAALRENGSSLEEFVRNQYVNKWMGDTVHHVMAIRTTFVNAMHNFLTNEGLFNMERVSLSPVTDPLAHDVEHTPSVTYKGHEYMTTHSMIYSKFLACFNPAVKGIFVDSPNIRLELESPTGTQRGRYLVDFSQMDIELRRENQVSLDDYLHATDRVTALIHEDFEKALSFFERLIIHTISAVVERNEENLRALGIVFEVPKGPFPRFRKDQARSLAKGTSIERAVGKQAKSQFFWIIGLMRENYDLIYPYLKPDGGKVPIANFTSDMIYNYDLCAQSLNRADNEYGPAYEISSGALREWLYEPIVERLIDNRIIAVRPKIENGEIVNVEELDGYGPFLIAAVQKDDDGNPLFPSTFGGGIGIERALLALCTGPKVSKVDDITLFGKNPDSHPLYLY
ncbi:MAG: hypothetical protein GF344_10720 [Chitinivibrionales bacterium]|nr:hypothetical protein [Chitinivibrionales bacterium]MBD3357283.1 hypothetical protein [Chitinivibrionales bacterium]